MPGQGARRRASPERDQAASSFALILEQLLDAAPFVRGAALFDSEGETVDYAGELEPFDMKIAAATLQIAIAELRDCPNLSRAYELRIGTPKAGYIIRLLDETYSLLLIVRPIGTFVVSKRVLLETEARVLDEAGMPVTHVPEWYRVEVEAGARGGRPRRVRPIAPIGADLQDPPWLDVDVLGAVMGLRAGEKGFRIRLASGLEVTLVRESRRLWFVDERIDVSNPTLYSTGKSRDIFRGS
ncbi:MAG: hypothetical protein HOV80_29475 [Polyangiaceae bacterium]|nr:hypothetical protein [Polyangiaceae bacterium]